jgi:cell wall-associated NlpC family hydrolase
MSIEAVVGRIDQIVAMQQQLADPGAAAAQSSSPTAGTIPGTTSAAAGAGSGSFTDALNSAMGTSALGAGDPATGATGALTPGLATAIPGLTGNAPAQVQAMTNMANSLVGKPYISGGGHGGWGPQSGYDCSGFVSAVLHAGGYLSQPVDTTALPSQAGMEPGPGQYVTVYDRALPGQSGHVIIELGGQFYESGGSHGAWGGGGGVEKIGTPSAAYLASFPTVLHPSGL